MANEVQAPDKFFLTRFGMSERAFERILDTALERKADYADLYFEYRDAESISLEESMVNRTSKSVSHGVGVRVCAEDRTGYAYSDEVTIDRMKLAAEAARAIADQRGDRAGAVQVGQPAAQHSLYELKTTPLDVPVEEKARLLNEIDKIVRASDPRVKNVMASFAAERKIVMIVNSEGRIAADMQPLCRLNVSVIVEDGTNRQVGTFGGGGRVEYSYLLEDERWKQYALEAARQAIVNLDAVDAPAGEMVVVLAHGWPGILLHEAIGHGLEGDFNRKGVSAFTNRIGQQVASPLCTVIDDGTIANRRGSLNVDDEGTPTSRTVLIEKGILRGYLQDTPQRAPDEDRADRKRKARKLRAHSDAADDQYLHAGGRIDARRDHRFGQARALRGQLRRRPGRYHQRQVRLLGERGLPDRRRASDAAGQRRNADRQRTRRADAGLDGRQRPGARFGDRHLRQGRAIGAGRRWLADDPD